MHNAANDRLISLDVFRGITIAGMVLVNNPAPWAKPFAVFGVNALVLFVASGVMARLLGLIKVPGADGGQISLQTWIFRNLFVLASALKSLYRVCYRFHNPVVGTNVGSISAKDIY